MSTTAKQRAHNSVAGSLAVSNVCQLLLLPLVLAALSTPAYPSTTGSLRGPFLEEVPFLESFGRIDGKEVLFIASAQTGSVLYNICQNIFAIDRVNGAVIEQVFGPADVAKLRPGYDEYAVLGVDSAGRTYLAIPGISLLIVSPDKVVYELNDLVDLAIQTQAGDELIAGTTKYSLFRLEVAEDRNGFDVWVTSIPSIAPYDTRECVFSVSPDGRFMYVGNHAEAWVWDDHGHLASMIAFGFQPSRLRDVGIDPEIFGQLSNVFVGFAPTAYFDRKNRLFLAEDGKFWVYDIQGRRISHGAGFELTGPDGEVVTPRGRWIFAPSDNHMFVINDSDDMVYEFDMSPVFEMAQDENTGIWYPDNRPPIFIRRFKPKLPVPEEEPGA